MAKARQRADALGVSAAALTFDRHPASFISGYPVPMLNTLSERTNMMRELYGIDCVRVLPFDDGLRDMPWESFAQEILLERYKACHLICGHDYRFGARGEGDAQKLQEFCAKAGIGFDCIEEICLEGQTVSSTLIRKLLLEGEAEKAAQFLGHPHSMTGFVVGGRQVGRTLGIPTANLQPEAGILLPRKGVYAAKAYFDGNCYPAVVNIGTRPTFDGHSITVEPWLLDFSGDLYGKKLRLEFHAYLRGERKFDTPQELREEILRNAETTRDLLK